MRTKHHIDYDRLFYDALRIRLVEERIAKVYPTDKIQSPVHLSIGQEHLAVGACAALKKSDLVFGTYRGHALYLAKGGSLKRMIAELYGKVTGCGAGKAGSMHLSDVSVGVMGCSAIVASTIPHSVGAALAAQIRKTNQVIVCFYGEGATGEGVYHESLNFAAKQKLPVLFLCENNDLAIYSKVSSLHSFSVAEHSKSYGIPSKVLKEGWDLQQIAEETRSRIDAIRAGEGPQLLEVQTYRYFQHVGPSEDYDIGYRSITEVEQWRARDPLCLNKELIAKYTPEIEAEIDEAFRFAEESEFPTKDDLFKDVL
jgi:TPP-dependent pyruvate/acetoin dehydrogenase alpha subunit